MSNQSEETRRAEAAAASSAAVGAKTARACDNCLRRRARWYCAADDAFLCQSCDSSVHSANPLARRHHRVRLKTSSPAVSASSWRVPQPDPEVASAGTANIPAWLHGFKRKARTPRGKQGAGGAPAAGKIYPLVPDLEAIAKEENREDDEDQLLYCVPIFDPDLAEFCCQPLLNDLNVSFEETKPPAPLPEHSETVLGGASDATTDGFVGFHPSEVDLAKFAEDIDTLLGRELENNDSSCINALGLMETQEDEYHENKYKVKPEVDDLGVRSSVLDAADACGLDMDHISSLTTSEKFDLDFGCDYPMILITGEAEEARAAAEDAEALVPDGFGVKTMILKLDYEAVIAAWSSKGCSPWTDGHRPQLKPGDCLPELLGGWGDNREGEMRGSAFVGQMAGAAGDGGREAKVSRYREKRRTRLFSKKIRYEVRKLNAEKRPRMKGRFVKRVSAAGASVAAAGGWAPISSLPY